MRAARTCSTAPAKTAPEPLEFVVKMEGMPMIPAASSNAAAKRANVGMVLTLLMSE